MKEFKLYIIIFFCALVFGIQMVRKNLFPYNYLKKYRNNYLINKNKIDFQTNWSLPTSNISDSNMIIIPVKYSPKYKIEYNDEGIQELTITEGIDTLSTFTGNVGLLMIDIWGYSGEDSIPSGTALYQKIFLHRARNKNMIIIHAPNHPVVDKYPQYQKIRQIVRDSLDHYKSKVKNPIFLHKPSKNSNEVWREGKDIRIIGRETAYKITPRSSRDITIHLKPNENEYVIASYEELRYVIWRHNLKLLIYMGGATNECMLHRDTGINRFAGIDTKQFPITIVVLEDCSSAGGSLVLSDSLFSIAMIEYYKQKLSFVSSSTDIIFE